MLEAASSSGSVRKQDVEDFRRLAAAVRLASQASRCKAAGMAELAAKQRTALLRYVGIVPADKVGGTQAMLCAVAWQVARSSAQPGELLHRAVARCLMLVELRASKCMEAWTHHA